MNLLGAGALKRVTITARSGKSTLTKYLAFSTSYLNQYTNVSKAAYLENQVVVDEAFKSILAENASGDQTSQNSAGFTLLMEGTPDCPKSLLSQNAMKVLTLNQIVPLKTVDLLKHPALFGYATVNCKKPRPPFLFQGQKFIADHDQLLTMHKNGTLQKISSQGKPEKILASKYYSEELPIAMY